MSANTLHFVPSADFHARARAALDDDKLRQSFRGAMDFLQTKRSAQFPDDDEFERMRDLGEAVRQHALARLPELLVQLEEKLSVAGVQVHWAEDAAQANAIVLGIAQAHRASRIIKGKSMVSEEIELNHYLAERGVNCIESDMGEYIVQLAEEKPSHIVMPAIHKTRGDIGALFEKHIPDSPYTEDVDTLIQTGRRALRQAFADAQIGLSGVNFAAADTGTLWLVENEGNGRLTTSVPDVHIAIMGMEKVVAKLEHIVPLASLLTRSATGQAITTYFNLISGQLKPSAGSVLLGGRDITGLQASARCHAGLGRAFQLTSLFPGLTVMENVRLALQSKKRLGLDLWHVWSDHKALVERADQVLESVALAGRRDALAAQLPHGDQRKLEVALLMALESKVFMFDEPTAGMNAAEAPVILNLIRKLKADPTKTILLVEHKMDVVRELADRIVVLHNGALVADGEPAEVIASPVVQEAYLGVPAQGASVEDGTPPTPTLPSRGGLEKP